MKRLMAFALLMVIVASPVFAATASRTGESIAVTPSTPGDPSQIRADVEYSTCGTMDCVPVSGGSATGWSEWGITYNENMSGQDITLVEFGFPVCGPVTGDYGWIVWTPATPDLPGAASTADMYGPFVPECTDPTTFPPTVYTYIDMTGEGVVLADGNGFWWGFDNTGMMGMVDYNGIDTWGWYAGAWDYDGAYGRTTVMQFKADFGGGTPVEESTWGAIKANYR